MGGRDAWQLDGEDLKGEVLDLVRVRHELQSLFIRGLEECEKRRSDRAERLKGAA